MFRFLVDGMFHYYFYLFALQRPFHARFVKAEKLARGTPDTTRHESLAEAEAADTEKGIHLYNYRLDTSKFFTAVAIGNVPLQNVWVQADVRLKQDKVAYTDLPYETLWSRLQHAGTPNTREQVELDTEDEWKNMDTIIKKYNWVQELIDSGKDKKAGRKRPVDEPWENEAKRAELVQLSANQLETLGATIEEFREYGIEATRQIGTVDFKVKCLYGEWTYEHTGDLCDGIQGRTCHPIAREFCEDHGMQYSMSFYMSAYGLQHHCSMLSMLWCCSVVILKLSWL